MNIPHARLAFKSLAGDWIKIVTGTVAAIVISLAEIAPIGKQHPWLPWVTFIVIWSWTWAWAFVNSWNREHRKVFILAREFLIPELQRIRHNASAGQITFTSEDAELNFYYEKLSAASRGIEREFLREMLAISKDHKAIVSGTPIQPAIWRAGL